MTLPIFGQRDLRWGSKKLGTSASIISNYGCLLCVLASVAKYYGKDTDPDRLNTALVSVGGFASGNLYIWNSLNKVYGDICETKNVRTPAAVTPTQFAEIEKELEEGRPVILQVDFNPGTPAVDMHFVVACGKEGIEYKVMDPWYGDVASLSRYGRPPVTIQQYVFTKGPLPAPVSGDLQIEIAGLRNQVAVYKQQMQDLSTKLGTGTDFADIIGGVKKLTEMELRIDTLNKSIESMVVEKERMGKELSDATTQLNSRLVALQEATKAQKECSIALTNAAHDIEVLKQTRNIDKFTTKELLNEILKRWNPLGR